MEVSVLCVKTAERFWAKEWVEAAGEVCISSLWEEIWDPPG